LPPERPSREECLSREGGSAARSGQHAAAYSRVEPASAGRAPVSAARDRDGRTKPWRRHSRAERPAPLPEAVSSRDARGSGSGGGAARRRERAGAGAVRVGCDAAVPPAPHRRRRPARRRAMHQRGAAVPRERQQPAGVRARVLAAAAVGGEAGRERCALATAAQDHLPEPAHRPAAGAHGERRPHGLRARHVP
jgi:hypothetical protein